MADRTWEQRANGVVEVMQQDLSREYPDVTVTLQSFREPLDCEPKMIPIVSVVVTVPNTEVDFNWLKNRVFAWSVWHKIVYQGRVTL